MPTYRERLWASAWVYLATALVIPASLLVLAPISIVAGAVTAGVLYASIVVALFVAAPVLEVRDGVFRAGRARIPLRHIGVVEGYRDDEAVAERGVRLDARAWLLVRGWVGPVVKAAVADPADPTPYWLVSTRRPAALVAALRADTDSPAPAAQGDDRQRGPAGTTS